MSTTYTATGSGQASASTQRAPNLLRRYLDAFQAWRIRQSLRTASHDLSDRELRDIGITRGEIDFLASHRFLLPPF